MLSQVYVEEQNLGLLFISFQDLEIFGYPQFWSGHC